MPFQVKVQYGVDFLKSRTFLLSDYERWTYVQFHDKILETIAPFLLDVIKDEIRISYRDDEKDFVTIMNSSLDLQDAFRYAEPIPKTESLLRLCIRVQQSSTPRPQNDTSVEQRPSFSKKSLDFGVSAKLDFKEKPRGTKDSKSAFGNEAQGSRKFISADGSATVSSSQSNQGICNNSIMSPIKHMFQKKQEDIIMRKMEREERNLEKEQFIAKIKKAGKLVTELEGEGARCGECHLPGHTVKTCENGECKSAEFCGLLRKHKEDGDTLDKIDRNITELNRTIETLESTLSKRKQTFSNIDCNINRQIRDILAQEYQSSYFHYGAKNWAKLNKDIAYVKKIIGRNSKLNLEEVKRNMDQKFMKDQFGFPESCVELLNMEKPSKQHRRNPSLSALELHGIHFPEPAIKQRQVEYGGIYAPSDTTEEEEQLKMALKLSNEDKDRNSVQTNQPKQIMTSTDYEAAQLLLSFKSDHN